MSGSCPQPSDTGQSSNNNIENAISHQTIETNDFNCTSYSGSLNNRLLSNLDHDLDDIDSTDELDDIDDLKGKLKFLHVLQVARLIWFVIYFVFQAVIMVT
jgi:hypothetical protein